MLKRIMLAIGLLTLFVGTAWADSNNCVKCHTKVTPGVVTDWKLSKHSKNDVSCDTCHGDKHHTMKDYDKADIPTPDTCAQCHEEEVNQFKKGKHAKAWLVMKAMPTIGHQPHPMIDGQKGCGACHKIGLKSKKEIKELRKEGQKFGIASCDACHTRHQFSVKEARDPRACRTCHTGFDHPQWEMYEGSKHGVRWAMIKDGTLNKNTPAPTCQACHLPKGTHNNRTAWGFLALRLPLPKDKQWAADRVTILQGLGVLDPKGKATGRLAAVKAADLVRLTQKDWQYERDRMVKNCQQCHAKNFAKGELEKGDEMIKRADHVMAESIRVIANLYKDGIITKAKGQAYAFPDILRFHDSKNAIEQKLWTMFMEYRMRTFEGTFHANPDYVVWYGWSEMVKTYNEIKAEAKTLRELHKHSSK